ncbi:hypothetical protein NESM_000481900 [Novymonas esmeraldas]|uniref:Uncharacterized protein n=1 Tax=Novymonas esmeraldas TaxID=1808958 RepID=A0AAW0EMX3_9TRYP
MQSLDIEQQLRLREAQTAQRQVADTAPALSYLHVEYLAAASDAIHLFGGLSAVTATLFLASALLVRTPLAATVRVSFQRSSASLIGRWSSPPLFAACMAVWMGLLGTQAVCDVLRNVALQHYSAVKETNAAALADLTSLHRIPVSGAGPRPLWGVSTEMLALYPPLLQWIMTPTALLFAVQYAGMVCVWCYMLFCGQPMEAGLMGALLTFFPTFYEALLLNGNEPTPWVVWVTLGSFAMSLLCVWSFGAPLVRREYREVMRELRGHTAQALFKDRPEMRDIRARRNPGGREKKAKQS